MSVNVYFTGTVQAIFFQNPSNFYKVMLVEVSETDSDYSGEEIVVNGIIGDILEGDDYTFKGSLTTHPKYGEQLTVESYEKAMPSTEQGLVKYFSSDSFPGIGKKTAEKIVELFPVNTVDAILEAPEKLDHILPSSKKGGFLKRLRDNHGMEKILSKLAEFGLSNKLNFQIYELYKEQTLEIIKENPYQLVEDVKGVGFKTADKIAQELGIESNSPERFRAGLMHLVQTQPNVTGDTYIEAKELLVQTLDMLEESRQVELVPKDVAAEIQNLIADGKVQQIETKIFENSLFFAEQGIENSLSKLISRKGKDFSESKINQKLEEIEEELQITYDPLQKEAIVNAINSQFYIITGGPGTGKTTIISGFLELYSKLYDVDLNYQNYTDDLFPILLAAPTGRASRRMNELTGLPAATLHRHLGINTDDSEDDMSDDLSGSLLIVDEFSMVDTWLANKLFQSIPPSMKVLIVGDADQLPSVGPGQIFADLLKISDIPSTRLNKIFRQGDGSTIVDLAHHIKDGQLPADFTSRQPDRSYFEAGTGGVVNLVEQIANSWKRKGNEPFELQILAPMYKGPAGIDRLNKSLQELFNPKEDRQEFIFNDISFRAGDKVLHLVNDAEANVFNGDLGIVTELVAAKYTESKQDEIFMDFDGQEISYLRSEWYKITLAYAMSIHKSQGSEFSTVIVPVVSSYSRMLQRNLVYTAITRAKQSLILIGEQRAFKQAVAQEGANRKTYLIERFGIENNQKLDLVRVEMGEAKTEEVESLEKILTEKMVLTGEFDPMIGLTEQDFEIFNKS